MHYILFYFFLCSSPSLLFLLLTVVIKASLCHKQLLDTVKMIGVALPPMTVIYNWEKERREHGGCSWRSLQTHKFLLDHFMLSLEWYLNRFYLHLDLLRLLWFSKILFSSLVKSWLHLSISFAEESPRSKFPPLWNLCLDFPD